MKLLVLGSGSCELSRQRSSPAYLVIAGRNRIMLDAGQGSLRRMIDAGYDPARLNALAISHHHPDHLADVAPLLFALNYDDRLRRLARLVILGHPKLEDIFEGLNFTFGEWLNPPAPRLSKLWLTPGRSVAIGGLRLDSFPANHMESSLAYRLTYGGHSLVYLGDSQASAELARFAYGADLLLAHCAGSEEAPKKNHMHPSMAGKLAAAARVKSLLLSHFYRDVDPKAAVSVASAFYQGPVWAAYDHMEVVISRDPGETPPALKE